MENVLTMMEAIGVNVRWDISWMKLERNVSVSTRTTCKQSSYNMFKNKSFLTVEDNSLNADRLLRLIEMWRLIYLNTDGSSNKDMLTCCVLLDFIVNSMT